MNIHALIETLTAAPEACARTQRDLLAFLDGELRQGDATAIAAHLADCGDCTAKRDEIAATLGLADAWETTPEIDVADAIARYIADETPTHSDRPSRAFADADRVGSVGNRAAARGDPIPAKRPIVDAARDGRPAPSAHRGSRTAAADTAATGVRGTAAAVWFADRGAGLEANRYRRTIGSPIGVRD